MAASSSKAARAALVAALLSGSAALASVPDEQVFMTPEQALARAFPGRTAAKADVGLSKEQRARVEKRLGWKLKDPAIAVYAAGPGDGYAVFAEEIGKHEPITFMVKVSADLRVEWVEVLVYREAHGSEVRRPGFLRQFAGKRSGERLRPGREVENITGATLSVRAVAAGVQRVLCILEEVYGQVQGR